MSIRKLQHYEKKLKNEISALQNEMIKIKMMIKMKLLDPTPYHLFELRSTLKRLDGLKLRLSIVSYQISYELSKYIHFQKYIT